MTTLALQSLSFSTKVLEKLLSSLKVTLSAMLIGYQVGRQKAANRQIAPMILHEYPHHTLESLLSEMNDRAEGRYRD